MPIVGIWNKRGLYWKTSNLKGIVTLDRETWDCFDSNHAWRIWIDYATVFVALSEGILLGVALLFKSDQERLAVLHKLFVSKNVRGMGVGTDLIRSIESELDHLNQDCILTTSL